MTPRKPLLDNHRALGLGPELVLMYFNRGPALLGANHAAARHQFQGNLAVQLRRPANADLQTPSREQVTIRGEQNPVAAHVDRHSHTALAFSAALAAQHLIADLPLDRKAVRAAAIILVLV